MLSLGIHMISSIGVLHTRYLVRSMIDIIHRSWYLTTITIYTTYTAVVVLLNTRYQVPGIN